MKTVGGFISHGRRGIHEPGVEPALPEFTEQRFPRRRVVVVATFLVGLHPLPVPISSGLLPKSLRPLLTIRIDPAREPALPPAPALVADPRAARSRSGPQIFGVSHSSCLLFEPGPHVVGLVTKVTADAATLGADALVPPLVEGRHRNPEEY